MNEFINGILSINAYSIIGVIFLWIVLDFWYKHGADVDTDLKGKDKKWQKLEVAIALWLRVFPLPLFYYVFGGEIDQYIVYSLEGIGIALLGIREYKEAYIEKAHCQEGNKKKIHAEPEDREH